MITRRTFVGALTAAGAVGIGLTSFGRRHFAIGEVPADEMILLRGRAVSLRGPGQRALRAVVEDVTVVNHPARPGAPGTEQISVLFAADGEAGFYRIENADLSLDELYLSPVGRPGRDRRLEAVITRVV
jgi:hypothetical protein